MELISTDDYFILQHLQRSETSLWVCRKTGKFSVRPPWDLCDQENPECLGLVWGIYGKLDIHPDVCQRLVLVKGCDRVGIIPGPRLKRHAIYRVADVVLVPLVPPNLVPGDVPLSHQLGLKPCPKHHGGVVEHADFREKDNTTSTDSRGGKMAKRILGAPLKLLSSDAFKSATSGNSSFLSAKAPWNQSSVSKNVERFERRVLEEFTKMFTESNSFYFSLTGDITNALQRQASREPTVTVNSATGEQIELFPTWRDVDDRFFFNRAMVEELIEIGDQKLDAWITPFIQGYVEIKEVPLDLQNQEGLYQSPDGNPTALGLPSFYTIILISRRSRHRAGTRYKRRGVDTDGHVANYVETEQILVYHHYVLSFLQVRGSVPLYWSQPGIKYRPPPKLDNTPEESKIAFGKHFQREFDLYDGPITCLNLVEKSGREKVIGDAYLDSALALDRTDMNFVYFDFHEYCRGMKFQNVNILINALEQNEYIRSMQYCWLDKHGAVCQQKGVFRVNCIDCLDRTNVVQTAIAKNVIETQLIKLGLIPPEHGIPVNLRLTIQGLWANNGDALSRQYAGTNALKGDFTRTGERNLSGLMKDGMNSASRYYLNQFRDAYRQATIDLMTGQIVSESLVAGHLEEATEATEDDESSNLVNAEHVRTIIEDCKKLLIPDMDTIIGAWGLIDNDPNTGDPNQEDMDLIVILTKDSYYVAYYDDEVDKVMNYQRVALSDIEIIEFGVAPHSPAFNLPGFKRHSKNEVHSLRLNYRMPQPPSSVFYDANGDCSAVPAEPASLNVGTNLSGFFHMFRATNQRFFNSMAVMVNTEEEKIESLKSVADSIIVAMALADLPPAPFVQGTLEKRKSKMPEFHSSLNDQQFDTERQRSAGSKVVSNSLKAISNVTTHFSRLNPMNKFRQNRGVVETAEVPQINIDSQQCDAGTLLSPNDLTTRSPAQSPIKGQDGLGASSNKVSKFSNMLSPLLSPSKDNSCGSSAVTLEAATVATSGGGQQQHYSSTSRLNISGSSSEHSSPRLTKARKISRSSEDVRSGKTQTTPASVASGGLKNVANKFLGVVELDPTTGDLHVRSGGSLQKNLDKTGHVLEEGAVETAAIIEKGVLNPFTKLTKGLGAVLKGHTEITTGAISDNALEPTDVAISTSSPVRSQNNQITNQLLQVKIDEAKSQTNIMLI